MARQVFFDPFGSYTQGFDQGAGRQIQTEGAARQARAQDFDFNNFMPYRLNEVKRQDELGNASLPVQKQLLNFTIPNAQANLYDRVYPQAVNAAQLLGVPAPLQDLMYKRFGLTPANTSVGGQPMQTLYMNGPTGELTPVAQNPSFGQTLLGNINFPRELQMRQLDNLQQYQLGTLNNAAARNSAYQTTAQARMYGALGRYYQGAGGVTGSSMAGGLGMPNELMNPAYYQNMQPTQDPFMGQSQQYTVPAQGLQDFNIGVQ